jgi:hypothetical protein
LARLVTVKSAGADPSIIDETIFGETNASGASNRIWRSTLPRRGAKNGREQLQARNKVRVPANKVRVPALLTKIDDRLPRIRFVASRNDSRCASAGYKMAHQFSYLAWLAKLSLPRSAT